MPAALCVLGRYPQSYPQGALVDNLGQVVGSSSGSRPEAAADWERQPQRPQTQNQTSATAASRRMPGVSQVPLNWPRAAPRH